MVRTAFCLVSLLALSVSRPAWSDEPSALDSATPSDPQAGDPGTAETVDDPGDTASGTEPVIAGFDDLAMAAESDGVDAWSDAVSASISSENGVYVDVPRDASDGVFLGGGGGALLLDIAGAESALPGTAVDEATVVFDGIAPATAVIVQNLGDDGVRVVAEWQDGADPVLPLSLTLDEGAQVVAEEDGSLSIVDSSGGILFIVDAAWAVDSSGAELPAEYVVNGTDIQLVVDTQGASWPVVADPKITSTKWSYDPSAAVQYAKAMYNVAYGGTGNAFPSFIGTAGVPENCTLFASQCLLAGLVGSSDPATVYAARSKFTADKGSLVAWYMNSASDRGPAFYGADALHDYAESNKATWKGLHFSAVTAKTNGATIDYGALQAGDILFADFTGDGTFDHTTVVTEVKSFWNPLYWGYARIRLTYQTENRTDKSLSDLVKGYSKISIAVFRPTDYNSSGR